MTTEEKLNAIRAKCVELLAVSFHAGAAEAGWKSTIAAIDLAIYSFGYIPAEQITFRPMINAILAAWEEQL